MKFYKKANGKWQIGKVSIGAGKSIETIDQRTGRITIKVIGELPGLLADKRLPSDFQDVNGNYYADLAAYEAATSDFFVDAALAAAEQLEVDLGVEVQNRTSEDINLQNQINTVVSGYLGAIAYNAAAPTPAKNGWYDFSTGGVVSWLTGTPTVKIGDRVSVLYTNPTYTYTYQNINLSGVLASKVDLNTKISRSEVVDSINIFDSSIKSLHMISAGASYTEVASNYYDITGFLPISFENSWVFEGCTTGNYSDGGCVAFFTDASNSNYLGAASLKTIKTSYKNSLSYFLGLYPTAKYIKFTLFRNGASSPVDLFTFKYYRAPIISISEKTTINSKLLNLIPYQVNFKINMLGDSFHASGFDDLRGFIYFASKTLGIPISQFSNYAIGGTKIARTSTGDTNTTIMVNRYTLMSDCDILCIMGGYNDSNAPFADWTSKLGTSATKTDKTTIWGAYSTIIEGFLALNPYSNAKIAVSTYSFAPSANSIALNNTIRDVAKYYNIPCIDFEKECGFLIGLNCQLVRDNILAPFLSNWIDGYLLNYNTGLPQVYSGWSYIPDYIQVPAGAKTLSVNINCNVHQYNYDGSTYSFITCSGSKEVALRSNCTHIRFAYTTKNKASAYIKVADGTVVDFGDIHPNLFGHKRMASVFSEKVKSIAIPL